MAGIYINPTAVETTNCVKWGRAGGGGGHESDYCGLPVQGIAIRILCI